VFDLFKLLVQQKKLAAKLHGVLITAGMAVSFVDAFWHVAKAVLVSTVQVVLQQRRLKFAGTLAEAPVLVDELKN
jgi:hypothetical protein